MKDTLQKYYDAYAELLQYDPEFYADAKSVTINWQYTMHTELNKLNNALIEDKVSIAIQIVKTISKEVVTRIQRLDPEELITQFESLQTAVTLMKEVNELYETWTTDFYEKFLAMFMSHGLFEEDELTPENVHPNFFINLDSSAKYMNSYKYKSGAGSLEGIETADLRMGSDVLIMEDVSQFFGYLRNVNLEDGVVYGHIVLKVEEREDLSHFIVAITYNGHSFLSTDAPSFATSQNKNSTRNARRHMESKYDNLAFPYILIDQLAEIRSGNTSVAKFGTYSLELYKVPIKGFDAYCKLFLIGITDILRKNAPTIENEVMLLSDYVETKLIGEFELTDEDNDLFIGHKEPHKKQLADVLETLEGSNTGIVKVGAELVKSSGYYDQNWLATPADLEKLSKWMALDAKRHEVQKALDEKFSGKRTADEAVEWLNKEINKAGNFERLWPFIFSSANETHFEISDKFNREYDEDGNMLASNHIGYGEIVVSQRVVSMFNDKKHYFTKVTLGFDMSDVSRRSDLIRTGDVPVPRSYDDYLWRDTCDCCGKTRNSIVKHFRILHWQQLCFLLDMTREELPAYLRAYKADQLLPYYGNQITSAVHPMSIVKHPSWKEYNNGITCTVHLCKRCTAKLNKQYSRPGETMITAATHEIVDLPENSHSLRFMSI